MRPHRIIGLISLATVVAVLAAPVAAAIPPAFGGFPQYTAAFQVGPPIPGRDSAYKSQGLAHLRLQNSQTDWLLSAMYNKGSATKLGIINRIGGAPVKTLTLEGPNHAGGLAISNRYLWVADTDDVLAYRLQDVINARPNQALKPARVNPSPFGMAASWITFADNYLWIGSHDEGNRGGKLYTFSPGIDGTLICCGVRARTIPTIVQGMEVTGRYFIFSRSLGQNNNSTFTLQNRSSGVYTHVKAPGMSQDGTSVGGNLYFNDESSSTAFGQRKQPRVRNLNYTTLDALIRNMAAGDR